MCKHAGSPFGLNPFPSRETKQEIDVENSFPSHVGNFVIKYNFIEMLACLIRSTMMIYRYGERG